MSSSSATQAFRCHDCEARITRLAASPSSSLPSTPSLLCPYCRSDFLEEMGVPSFGADPEYYLFNHPYFEELINHLTDVDQDASLLGATICHSLAASKSAVEALPTIKIAASSSSGHDPLVCAICKDQIEVSSEAKKLPCSHLYHSECILPWLSGHNSCPLCRFCLPTEAEESEKVSMSADAVAARRMVADGYSSGLGHTLRILARRHGVDLPVGDGDDGMVDEAVEALLSGINGVVGV